VGLLARLHRFKTDWRLLAPLLLLNVVGMAFGWYYYWDVGQFDPASRYYQPPWTWPLVADSPNAVALFFVAALAYKLTRWRNRWLDALAFVLNVYVGCWTTMLFLAYRHDMGTFDYASVARGNANPVLFIAHMGMPLQAFVLWQDLRRDRWGAAGIATVLAFLALYVWVDYWPPLLLHPAPFLHPHDRVLHVGSPILMAGAAVVWLGAVLWPKGPEPRPWSPPANAEWGR